MKFGTLILLLLVAGAAGLYWMYGSRRSPSGPSDAGKEAAPEDPSAGIVRGADVQGLRPASDQAVEVARRLHAQLHPAQKIKGEAALVSGNSGKVILYLAGDEGGQATYWVGRGPDGLWQAYARGQIPLQEDYRFVFTELARRYLVEQYGTGVKLLGKPVLEDRAQDERRGVFHYTEGGARHTLTLLFKKDPDAGWAVSGEAKKTPAGTPDAAAPAP